MLREQKLGRMAICFVWLLLGLFSTGASAANWIKAGGDVKKLLEVYYDAESVKVDKEKGLISVVIKNAYTNEGVKDFFQKAIPPEEQAGDWKDFSYHLNSTELDYKNKKFKVIKVSYHTKTGEQIVADDSGSGWRDIIPGSLLEVTMNMIIGKEKPKIK